MIKQNFNVGDKVEIICFDYEGSLGEISVIHDEGDHIIYDIELMDVSGIKNSDYFMFGEFQPASIN